MVSLSRKNSDLELPTTVHHDSPAGYYQLVKLRSRSWALHSQRRKYLKGIGIIIVIIGFTFLLCRPNQASLAELPDDWNAVDQQEGENRMWSETDTDVWGLDKDTLHSNPMRPAVSVGIDHAAARLVEGLVPLEDNDPNPTVQSVLGQEAENAYVYGSRTLDDYFTSLSTFIDLALPQSMSKILHVSLERYAENKHPKWYLSGDSDRLPGLGEKSGTRNIWQTDANSEHAESAPVASWRENGEGWKWMLLNDADAAGYVSKHLKKSKLKAVWDALPSGILHSDMLRYLVLLIEGGIYSDTDTKRLKPISEWGRGARLWRDGRGWLYGNDSGIELGDELRGVENDDLTPPSVVVGIEADVGDREDWHDWWPRPVQIVQWTISSTPYHPIALDVLRQITHQTAKAIDWQNKQSQTVQKLTEMGEVERAEQLRRASVLSEPSEGGPVGVMNWTGPGVWTDAVLRYLRVKFGLRWTDLKDLQHPLRIGEILILPVTGFSPGVGLFGAKSPWDEQAMVEHLFAGSWKNH